MTQHLFYQQNMRNLVAANSATEEWSSNAERIESLEKVMLGGAEQWIYIHGKNQNNPAILILHGGPGAAMIGRRGYHRLAEALENDFTVVFWDQRGAGKSYSSIHDASHMNLGQFVEDTVELSNLLRTRFKQDRIFLAGHSWGSVMGTLAAQGHPEFYRAYLGIGQSADDVRGEAISYQWVLEQAKKAGDDRAVRKLEKIAQPYSFMDLLTKTNYLGKFGAYVYGDPRGDWPDTFGVLRPWLFGLLGGMKQYTFWDRINFVRGFIQTLGLVDLTIDNKPIILKEEVPELEMPVFFISGEQDYVLPHTLAEEYLHALRAPVKRFFRVPQAAHCPHLERPDAFVRILVEEVLPAVKAHEESRP